ncbi:MAG: hypothetical protein OXQ94_06650 [Gemmatimonadota bacterium]|nr:hypothetical protein [Gemmatimonadota bacterium]MDE2871353.1 hypothetical protein [Gemmatimonadota bacterium]
MKHRIRWTLLVLSVLVPLLTVTESSAQDTEIMIAYEARKKSGTAAGILGLLPVVGHVYAGNTVKGLLPATLTVGGVIVVAASQPILDAEGSPGGQALGLLMAAAGTLWSTVSAVGAAKEFNRDLLERLGTERVTMGMSYHPHRGVGLSFSVPIRVRLFTCRGGWGGSEAES